MTTQRTGADGVTRIIVVGAGSHGAVVADILMCAQRSGAAQQVIGFVDDTPGRAGAMLLNLPILGDVASLSRLDHDAVVVAIGDNSARRRLTEMLTATGERLASAIHPSSTIAASAQLGDGVVIAAGAIVQPLVVVGRGVILNTQCSVDHETVVEDFAHLSAGATVGGLVRLGTEVLVALGASVTSRMTVGARSTVGAGAVVVRDLPSDVVAWGSPARVMRPAAATG